MFTGLTAGILWGLDTVILGIALAMSPFASTEQAIFLAPFVSTFLHDACSSIWMIIYMGIRKQYKATIKAFKTRSGKFIVLGALLGGPIGMSGYVAAINFIGPAYTAIISSMFPAVGALLARVFLKEKMSPLQWIGLAVSIGGVIAISYTPGVEAPKNLIIGIVCALVCVFGWSAEAVICAYGMKDPDVSDEHALQIRQLTSAIFYGVVLLPVLSGWGFAASLVGTKLFYIIVIAALFGTASYLCYYKAIVKIGAAKSMALNITYTAWAIIFAFFLLGDSISLRSIILGIIIICGSLIAANFLQVFKKNNTDGEMLETTDVGELGATEGVPEATEVVEENKDATVR